MKIESYFFVQIILNLFKGLFRISLLVILDHISPKGTAPIWVSDLKNEFPEMSLIIVNNGIYYNWKWSKTKFQSILIVILI